MRVSHVTVEVTAEDLNSWIADLMPGVPVRILAITPAGIHGQVKLFFWYVDFTAVPSASADELALEITAHKLVPIPAAIVQRQLREAVKDAPPGVEAIQQSLRVHLPSLLAPLGLSMTVKELRAHQDVLRCVVEHVELPKPSSPWNQKRPER